MDDVGEPRLALTVAYDGTDYFGSQRQPGVRTVQADVEAALSALFGTATTTVFAGRTDRGVHAAGQVVGCPDARPDLGVGAIAAATNARLPEDVLVVGVERRAGFHARYDARWREYRYRIGTGVGSPLARRQVWQREAALDTAAMDVAAARLVGERDFASLAGGGDGVPWSERRGRPRGTVRRLSLCRCRERVPWWGPDGTAGRLIEVRMVADGFLPQMVRNTASALVAIGRGTRRIEWLDEILAARDRRLAPAPAPAHGLTFWRVGYGDDRPDDDGRD